ncbi:MAG: S8 family serine peptidase, partial [Methanosarcinaceae archaeon]
MYNDKKYLMLIFLSLLIVFSVSTTASEVPQAADLDSGNAILLKITQFDTSMQPQVLETSSLEISSTPEDTEEYYIVQFKDHVAEEWKQDIRDSGAVIFNYVPNNAFIIRMAPSVKAEVESFDHVQWIGLYHPVYRVSPALSSVTMTGDQQDIIVMLFDANDNARIMTDIMDIGGEILDNGDSILRIRIDGTKIPDIAAMNGVSWVEMYIQPVILNDVAAGIMNVSYVRNTHGLTGSGQIVAVADTGLDTGYNNESMHDDLEGRIETIHAWWTNYNDTGAEDNHGHGTHVAGSVLGNGSHSSGLYAGTAPDASLVFQAMQYDGPGPLLYSGSLYLPTNLSELFQEAYDDGARIHSNSWGSENSSLFGNYTSDSHYIDSFMWDNPDMLIIFAAGNYRKWTNGISVCSPGTAKNALTVGASQSSR